MKNIMIKSVLLFVLSISLFVCSCSDKMGDYYDAPSWFQGSAWKILEAKGDYSIFLKGAELAGYKPIMNGNSILTIMAPDDKAFSEYLSKHGYSDISEVNTSELQKLIGFHLLYYSYNKDKLVNFRPEGDLATDEEKEKNAGMYYKFRTRSSNTPTVEIEASTGRRRTVYHLDRFIPVFSSRFFQTKTLDAASNYNYFYPNTIWKGDEGFNVSNAAVNEYGILADNGYIYTVDQVLEPLETIYTKMKTKGDYSIFSNLYDQNTSYVYDATLSKDYGTSLGADSLFIHTHGSDLPAIAVEWYSTKYADVADNASKAYSVFAPSDDAMNKFFDDYWEQGGYESLSDVDALAMKYLLKQFVYPDGIVFPEEIKSRKVKNVYDMNFNFDPDKVTDKSMCVNGVFYGLNTIDTPLLFGSVVGPAFRNKNNNYYLYMLAGAGLIVSYSSQDTKYVLLMPTNEIIQSEGISLRTYADGSRLQQETEDGLADVSTSVMRDVVNLHTVTGVQSLKETGTQILATQMGFNYLFVKDGKITTSAAYTQLLEPDNNVNPFVSFSEIKNGNASWNNGKTYSYGGDKLFKAEDGDGLKHRLAVCNDSRYVYYQFAKLLQKSGMVTSNDAILDLIGTSHFISFIPTNQAISDAISAGKIPGMNSSGTVTSASQLRQYLLNYIIRDKENAIVAYPYPGSDMKSATYISANGNPLIYTDNGSSITININGESANVVSTYNYFPFAFNDGCFQLINTVL
ncbi:fasciclin domain-containing protein [Prevotella sp.]|uniref:fasciclin domain-containing protein n=1 Tax=Prevotella sp. TaxID=59823 RepID=UPI002647300B|nr:fasciclin domain-containing protein [Prevotella sp.]MDN5554730.1 fasciclin domain-containing protein [Prevotella sp.]